MSFAFCGLPFIADTGSGGSGGVFSIEEVGIDLQAGDELEINPAEEESVTVVIGVS